MSSKSVWGVSAGTKIKLYKCLIMPLLLYSIAQSADEVD